MGRYDILNHPPQIVRSEDYKTKGADAFIDALMALPPAKYIEISADDFKPGEGLAIDMYEAGITNAASPTPILGTYGFASCMGIALFNPVEQAGGVAHLVQDSHNPEHLSPESRRALTNLLAQSRSDTAQRLEIRIMGPINKALKGLPFMHEILSMLMDQPNVDILSADFGGKEHCSAFGIDTRRWSEGLLKGAPLVIPGATTLPDMEARKYIVPITALKPASQDGSFCDARVSKATLPAAGTVFDAKLGLNL